MISLLAILLQAAAPAASPPPNPAEFLAKQIEICSKYSDNKEGMDALVSDLVASKLPDDVKLDTLKVCIAFREGRIYQHTLDTRV
jgi:hypothetical protein